MRGAVLRAAALIQALLITLVAASTATPTKVTVWTWPLSAASPLPLAHITLSDDDEQPHTVSDYKPPEIAYSTEEYVRVGLYDPATKDWRGSLTSAASFNPKNQHRLSLHIDEAGLPYHVDFAAFAEEIDEREERRRARRAARDAANPKKPVKPKKKTSKSKVVEPQDAEQPTLEIIKQRSAPAPVLNKPVILDSEGKTPSNEPEKTFFQK